jgi:hypothetical protein
MLMVVKYCLFIIIQDIMGFHILKSNLLLYLKMELISTSHESVLPVFYKKHLLIW